MSETTDNTVLELARELIAIPSVTPDAGPGQAPLRKRLEGMGFRVEDMTERGVANLYARLGNRSPVLAFGGHTDVVPTGDPSHWSHPPFHPTVAGGRLFGRGAADMKGAIAAFTIAVERFLERCPHPGGSLLFLITGDEEGPALHGTQAMIRHLQEREEGLDYCLIGEPSCWNRLGDTIKNGRRGSLTGNLTIRGIQGHVAYPDKAANPIHKALPILHELATTQWDEGTAYFPPTSFQIPNISAGTGAHNVIPGSLHVQFNFRYSPERTKEDLVAQVTQILNRGGLDYELQWQESGAPFLTEPEALVSALTQSIREVTGIPAELSTSGGTSDGRFIAPLGVPVAELGPLSRTIHQVDEHVGVAELTQLAAIYEGVLKQLLAV